MSDAILILHLAAAMMLLWLIVKDQIDEKRGFAMLTALVALATGAYNFMTRMAGAPKGWHILIGIKTLLAEKDKWDRDEVFGYILPMLEAVQDSIAEFHKEICSIFINN